ncbi:MAG: aminotransferase class I/II-fold pyridoxal phosphate-dependent enzyme [Planctomycetota bacterium]|nr:MAG: aminotransferase class I/II-fold pyridoxal phosphate-dependent enzyme [Planctomycetota bacterium]
MIRFDFRSDTVTRPCAAMRRAMAEAEVGDDVFGDDPTVRRLEERAAAWLGKEAAVFVPSGTMANLIALCVHARPGEEALCEARAHVAHYEQAAAARFAGVQLRPLPGDERGALSAEAVAGAIRARPDDPEPVQLHCPRTAVCLLENTHNFSGGRVVPLADLEAVARVCRARGVAVHLDGARLANAAAATGIALDVWSRACDSVALAFSKGLGAPVGSVLAGPGAWCFEARRVRKALGGAMRQSGVLAAAALVALERGLEPLRADHRRARRLAEGLAELEGIEVDPERVETNIVFVRHRDGQAAEASLCAALAEAGVGAVAVAGFGLRFVTHRDVGDDAVEAVLRTAAAWCRARARRPAD